MTIPHPDPGLKAFLKVMDFVNAAALVQFVVSDIIWGVSKVYVITCIPVPSYC